LGPGTSFLGEYPNNISFLAVLQIQIVLDLKLFWDPDSKFPFLLDWNLIQNLKFLIRRRAFRGEFYGKKTFFEIVYYVNHNILMVEIMDLVLQTG